MPLPWDAKTARVWCTCFRNREERDDPGAFLTSDCRANLKRIQAEFTSATGLHLRAGTEPEMMWLKQNPDGTPSVEGMTKPFCYHIDQFAELQPLIHRVIDYAGAMGIDMIQGDHEDAPGQLELNFQFDRAEQTADNLSTYRQICKQVGRELGAFPCFMPKPFMGVSANGCHHNISLWRGDENVFMPDTDDPQKPSQIGLWAIGGIIEHLPALTCISASTVNSYRRLWDTGFWAPVFADWGYQNRTTALRVSAPGRFEYRSVDSAVNPYLSLAGLIIAMWDGIERQIDPGDPEERNIYEAMEAGKQVTQIPMTFGDALAALEADEVVRRALPGDMYRVFMHYKKDEWERYCAEVTDWDVKEYLDVLPVGTDGEKGKGSANVRDRWDHLPRRAGARHRERDDPDAPVDEAPRAGLDGLRPVRAALDRLHHAVQARGCERRARTSSSRSGSSATGARPRRGWRSSARRSKTSSSIPSTPSG